MSSLILPKSVVAQRANDKINQHIDKLAEDKAHNITWHTQNELRTKRTLIDLAEKVLKASKLPYDDRGVDKETQEHCIRYTKLGKDFEVILKAIENNPTLQSEWERFLMVLKLAEEQ